MLKACMANLSIPFLLQPVTAVQFPVSRQATFPGFGVPSYPVVHSTLAVASYVVSV